MAKVTLNDLTSLSNEASAVATINNNNTKIEQALDKMISRDGTTPNQMDANFDMNGKRIINLPKPVAAHEPLRLQELNNFTVDLDTRVAAAAESAANAAVSEANADADAAAAASSEANAFTYSSNALTYATQAFDYSANALTYSTSAQSAADAAWGWAETPHNVEVMPGEYSAKHWAAEAQAIANQNATGITTTPAGNLSSTNVQAALNELDTEKASNAALSALSTTVDGKLDESAVSALMLTALDDTTDEAVKNTLKLESRRQFTAVNATYPNYNMIDVSGNLLGTGSHLLSNFNGKHYLINLDRLTSISNTLLTMPNPPEATAGDYFILTVTGSPISEATRGNVGIAAGYAKMFYRGKVISTIKLIGGGETWRFTCTGDYWFAEILSQPKIKHIYGSGGYSGGSWNTSPTAFSAVALTTISGSTWCFPVPSNALFKPPVDGRYRVRTSIYLSAAAGGNQSGTAYIQAYMNGGLNITEGGQETRAYINGQDAGTLNLDYTAYLDSTTGFTAGAQFMTNTSALWWYPSNSTFYFELVERV